jgi:hypothetical protein
MFNLRDRIEAKEGAGCYAFSLFILKSFNPGDAVRISSSAPATEMLSPAQR